MSAFKKITRNEIEQVAEHVTEQVVELMERVVRVGNGLASTWRFFGDSDKYLATGRGSRYVIGSKLVHKRVVIMRQRANNGLMLEVAV